MSGMAVLAWIERFGEANARVAELERELAEARGRIERLDAIIRLAMLSLADAALDPVAQSASAPASVTRVTR